MSLFNRAFHRFVATIFTLACLVAFCATSAHAQRSGLSSGDRVEVNRGEEWTPATVIGSVGSRIRVRLDDDGSLADMPAERREKRLTRTYSASDIRRLRGERTSAPPAAPPTSLGGFGPSTATAATRTWSDESGRFNIEATYCGINGDKVILEKFDGSRIEVPLAKLASADQEYVKSQGGDPENPFAVAATMPAGGGFPLGAKALPPTIMKSSKSGMKTIRPKDFSDWSFDPQSIPLPTPASSSTHNLRLSKLPDSKAFFEDIVNAKLSTSGDRALVVRKKGNVGGDDISHVEVVDLVAGRSVGIAALPEDADILDIDADLGWVAYTFDTFHDRKNQLIVAEIRGSRAHPLSIWEPHGDASWDPSKSVGGAKFVNGGRIVTSTFHSDVLTVWDVATRKATHAVPIARGFQSDDFNVSPDGRYTAMPTKAGFAILDLIGGKHVATLSLPAGESHRNYSSVAFNATNTKLCAISFKAITVWDLKTGKQLNGFHHETMFPGSEVMWAGDFLFHRNKYLYDYQTRVLLWEFTGTSSHDLTTHFNNGRLLGVAKDRKQGMPLLRTFDMPTDEMIEQAEKLRSGGSLVVARAGDPVAIELDIDRGIISPEEVRQRVEENLRTAGYVIAEESDVVVKAVCKRLPSQTIEISDFHASPWGRNNVQERTVTPHPSSLTLSYQGKTVWRRGNMGRPGAVFHMQKGESLDQALVRLTTPNTKLLLEAEFPQEIIRPGTATSSGAYGVTNLATGASGGGARFE